jgi:HSP20 family protein
MANIAITKENGGTPAQRVQREWDPFQSMRELMRWDPFQAMWPSRAVEPREALQAAFDVKETKEAFVFKADVPGIDVKDVEVKIQQNRLTISGKREQEKTEQGETYYAYERSYGSFIRSFTLPEGVDADNIAAELKEGVLTLTLPKKPEMKPRRVAVKNG